HERAKQVINRVARAIERQPVLDVERKARRPGIRPSRTRAGEPGLDELRGREPLVRRHEHSAHARHRFNSATTWTFRECKSRARRVSEKRYNQSWPLVVAVHSSFQGSESPRKSSSMSPWAYASWIAKYVRSLNGAQVAYSGSYPVLNRNRRSW